MLKSAWKKVRTAVPKFNFLIRRRKKPKAREELCTDCGEWNHTQLIPQVIHDEYSLNSPSYLIEETTENSSASSETRPSAISFASRTFSSVPPRSHRNIRIVSLYGPQDSEQRFAATGINARPSANVTPSLLRANSGHSVTCSSNTSSIPSEDISALHLPSIQTSQSIKKSSRNQREHLGITFFPGDVANGFSSSTDALRSSAPTDSETSLDYQTPPGLDTGQPSANQYVSNTDTIQGHTGNSPSPGSTGIRVPAEVKSSSTFIQNDLFSSDLKVETIGSGVSGKVYKVTREAPHGQVVRAVKLIDLREKDDAGLRVYAQEVRTLKLLWKEQMYFGRDEDDQSDDESHRGMRYIMKLLPQEDFVGICAKSHLYIVMASFFRI
ncbi:hypothetical protein CPB84DRAFT_1021341 [Gymnopilus junonius]|uniref:Protein kinase domain-containing protein n=1 Tax=Gymnopilus junonius TaxID=109634 RepID=A0A9P5TM54_GYMJU|nr:hypothetical protein CPB84DRAFT_1021341 [Gymnopilus junonius]